MSKHILKNFKQPKKPLFRRLPEVSDGASAADARSSHLRTWRTYLLSSSHLLPRCSKCASPVPSLCCIQLSSAKGSTDTDKRKSKC